MLELHIRSVIGHVPVNKLDYRVIAHRVRSMMAKGKAPKTIHNVHGLISAGMNTAEMLGYISRNPCRGVQLDCGGHGGAVQGLHQFPGHDRNALWRSYRADCGADVDPLSKPPTAALTRLGSRMGRISTTLGPPRRVQVLASGGFQRCR
ncbi:hypothetical protein [Arthrobacter sp. PAMC25564]|uniref:hypothetical protein n=1 Tax=Arthrobacter sp. PAMC25564 TaxID=2565366 RepID=UPI00197C796A|nr:hypothetical protein [Arthrobacter sp. PAMC25564]